MRIELLLLGLSKNADIEVSVYKSTVITCNHVVSIHIIVLYWRAITTDGINAIHDDEAHVCGLFEAAMKIPGTNLGLYEAISGDNSEWIIC